MKGVILAGGLGTRLYPLTYATNKHLLPVYDKPMIFYPINTLVQAGIKDVMVVTGGPHAGHFLRVLRNGKELGLNNLAYAVQEGERGIAAALSLAEEYVDGENVCVILGDNCTDADIHKDVVTFEEGARIFLKEVEDPQRFGVPAFNDEGKIIKLTEKPVSPDSNFAITGLYFYDKSVFDRIRKLKPSDRGELEVTDLNQSYLDDNKLGWAMLNGFWKDAGTYETLIEVGTYWWKKRLEEGSALGRERK
ncbi:spore coat protein [Candidatus Woesebacteria bacterium RIFCSPLOWO2_01_FULL_39_23]|uniref:glucose-1-phosphate thymidylyltransferase n=1 Tax=Candidatus Woesebacteria bacterium RIFCSPHIGHO2_01_FULL_40_22 TaxID=1802499 RepID=A0A1F7YEP1_9BACT|nr:MAG: spore coat protein [Candidatus Woesebacteria bacterium RBG_16_40_11]OGM25796.1 MAG: spore coat protein [Candidatus Woesebacteria bacterium RIFCSPHIGHO2_01_FULL_40_22]OGM61749.1 MAG: spore coat protein [Candidatus Woesebacteria bacterium RIFCSPLOWO2_01_FULL_39_23]